MTWPATMLCFGVCFLLGYAWSRKAQPESLTEDHDAEVPDAWMERHQRLKDHMGLAVRDLNVNERRTRAKLTSLQLHLSPHFMFNALSSVQWLWSESKHDEARGLFASFVALWKHHWREEGDALHSLEAEMDTLQAYVHLESSRLGHSVSFRSLLDPDISKSARIPALLFQPAVENALWHAFRDPPVSPQILLSISTDPDGSTSMDVVASVLDNGRGLHDEGAEARAVPQHTSWGLNMTREKLRLLDNTSSLEILPAEAPWSTEVRFRFPLSPPDS
ncbi:MAG: sensor histidine kinase [Flavobacteriales bacterium]